MTECREDWVQIRAKEIEQAMRESEAFDPNDDLTEEALDLADIEADLLKISEDASEGEPGAVIFAETLRDISPEQFESNPELLIRAAMLEAATRSQLFDETIGNLPIPKDSIPPEFLSSPDDIEAGRQYLDELRQDVQEILDLPEH